MFVYDIPNLTIKWTDPTPHEKLIYNSQINEIFYDRFFIFIIIPLFLLMIGNLVLSLSIIGNLLVIVTSIIIFGVLSPYFFRPWDIVLSNKRLILRSKYWNIGRFSAIKSFNLYHLNSQLVTPRIKIIPLTIGFTILFSYSLPLIEFSFTGSISPPMFIKILLLLGGIFGKISDIKNISDGLIFMLFSPFFRIALIAGLLSTIIAILLIIFGLPRRTSLQLSTTGGHNLFINAGMPDELIRKLSSIGRKHRTSDNEDWAWDLPLLEGEIPKNQAQIGLIDRKTQMLGLLSLILSFESLNRVSILFSDPNISNFILMLLFMINFIMTYFSISFAKKFRRLISTNHRLLFQDERQTISGIYGKRIYSYTDLPFENIRGFSYSNFSGFDTSVLGGVIIILITGYSYAIYSGALLFVSVTSIVIVLYLILNYRTFTNLTFISLSGSVMEMKYRIAAFMISLSHRIEHKDNIVSKIFPNLFTEHQVVSLCNDVRHVENPVLDLKKEDKHEISVNAFIDRKDDIIGKWEKIGTYKYFKESTVLGSIVAIMMSILLSIPLSEYLKIPFLIISIVITIIIGLRRYVVKYTSLILVGRRLFFSEEVSPRSVALLFGVLPEKRISEVDLEHLNLSQFKFRWGKGLNKLVNNIVVLVISLLLYNNTGLVVSEEVNQFILIITAMITVVLVPSIISTVFNLIPRYRLSLYTRYGEIMINYMKGMDSFSNKLSLAKGEI